MDPGCGVAGCWRTGCGSAGWTDAGCRGGVEVCGGVSGPFGGEAAWVEGRAGIFAEEGVAGEGLVAVAGDVATWLGATAGVTMGSAAAVGTGITRGAGIATFGLASTGVASGMSTDAGVAVAWVSSFPGWVDFSGGPATRAGAGLPAGGAAAVAT
jgi:hypothetical protein